MKKPLNQLVPFFMLFVLFGYYQFVFRHSGDLLINSISKRLQKKTTNKTPLQQMFDQDNESSAANFIVEPIIMHDNPNAKNSAKADYKASEPMMPLSYDLNTAFCVSHPKLCENGHQLSLRIEKHRYDDKIPAQTQSNNTVYYLRSQPGGLPSWIAFFLEYRLEECSATCKIIDFDDLSVRAHATVAHQQMIRKEAHEVQVMANLEAHSHESILDCLDRGEKSCWHASFFMSSRIPITYSLHTFYYMHVFEGLEFMLSTQSCAKLDAKSEFLKSWYCLLNSLTVVKKKVDSSSSSAIGVAFISASCGRHEDYVKKLMESIHLDMMGGCFKTEDENQYLDYEGGWWPSSGEMLSNRDFRKTVISSKYQFYISIENTILHDYLTEKFWIGFLTNAVMVYLGAPNAEAYAPARHSFVNALDFPDAHALGQYLAHLSAHKDEYDQYLSWKTNNSDTFNLNPAFLSHFYYDMPVGCRLCYELSRSKESHDTLA